MSSNKLKLKLFVTSDNIFFIKSLPLWSSPLQLKLGSADMSANKQKLEKPRIWKHFLIRLEQFSKQNTISVLNLIWSLVWRRVIRRRRNAVAIVVKKTGKPLHSPVLYGVGLQATFWNMNSLGSSEQWGKKRFDIFLATFQGGFFLTFKRVFLIL